MKHIIVKPIANPVMKKRAKFAKKLLGMSMTAGLVLLIGSAGWRCSEAAGWRCASWEIEAGSSSANGRTACSLCGSIECISTTPTKKHSRSIDLSQGSL